MTEGLYQAANRAVGLIGLVILSPVIGMLALLIWIEDRESPFYVATRIGLDGTPFDMWKFRSMVVGADRAGVNSTSITDRRITRVGGILRRYKLDEIPQLVNVWRGDLNMVGPRPQVAVDVAKYTPAERRLLSVRPGITDLSSIVFSDEGEILVGATDADEAYDRLIRPWKSRLGIFYVDHRSVALDLRVLALTALSLGSRDRALIGVSELLGRMGASDELVRVARRGEDLWTAAPP